jgi:hypothetical protein
LNAAIEIVYPTNTDTLNGSAASAITYNQGGAGAQDRTVEAKLQETVSVKDFGAVGDGVTDDTSAIQAADATGIGVTFTKGTYLVSTNTTLSNEVIFERGATLKIPSGVTVTCNGIIRCDNGAAVSTGAGSLVTNRYDITVGAAGTFATVQEAFDFLPKNLYQKVRITVLDGETFNEDLRVDGFSSCNVQDPSAAGTESATIQLMSENSTSVTASSISSLRANGNSGMMIQILYLKWTGTSPYDNEDATIQAYNAHLLVTGNDFSNVQGVNYPTAASKAISSYAGLVRCGSNNFGSSVFKAALTVKSGGTLADDGDNTGTVTEQFARTQSGYINLRRSDEVIALGGKVRAASETDQGFVTDTRSRSIWGMSSFAQPYAEVIDSHFESLDWLEQTLTSGGATQINTTRGLQLQTTGGTGGTVNLEYNRFLLIGDTDWEDGLTSAFWAIEAQAASANATFYAIVGDLADKYVGIKVVNAIAYAVYNDGTGETVAGTYSGTIGRAVYGFTYSSNQIDFYDKNGVDTILAVATADLPTGAMPNAKIQYNLVNNVDNCTYNVLSQRVLFTPNNQ